MATAVVSEQKQSAERLRALLQREATEIAVRIDDEMRAQTAINQLAINTLNREREAATAAAATRSRTLEEERVRRDRELATARQALHNAQTTLAQVQTTVQADASRQAAALASVQARLAAQTQATAALQSSAATCTPQRAPTPIPCPPPVILSPAQKEAQRKAAVMAEGRRLGLLH